MNSFRALNLDGSNTEVAFRVQWFGLVTVRGVFDRVRGGLRLGESGLSSVELTLEVESASVRTGIGLRDRHLRAERFLNADLHPLIRFSCRAAEFANQEVRLTGDLALRGAHGQVRCRCSLGGALTSDDVARLTGTTVVSRKHFGVGMPPGLAGLNPLFLAIADDVHIDVRLTVPAAVLRSPALATAD